MILARAAERRFPPAGRFTTVGGRKLHVVEHGAGPPVLLVHGAAGRAADILPPMRAPLGDAVRLIAPARAGTGWSDAFEGAPRLARHAADLAEFIAEEGLERPLVIGHSYGAAVALRLALDAPDRVGALVCLGPASHGDVGPVKAYNHIALKPLVGPLVTHVLAPAIGPFLAPAGVRSSFTPQTPPADYAETSQQALLFRPASFKSNCADLSAVNPELLEQQERYPAIRAPVAVVAGEDDDVVLTRRHAERLAAAIPDSRLCLLPGVGHMPHFARPEIVAEHVFALLESS